MMCAGYPGVGQKDRYETWLLKNWSISLESAADDRFNDEALINLIFSSISPRFLWFVAVKVIQVCTFFDENAFKLN